MTRAERLRSLADDRGIVAGFAFDHRDSLDVVLADAGLRPSADGIRRLKAVIVREVAPLASTVMLDHDYGADAIASGAIPAGVALVMPLEAQGYAQLGDERRTTFLPDFGPRDAARLGAAATKLLVPMRPDRETFTRDQLSVAGEAVAASHRAGLPIVLEPQVYPVEGESAEDFAARRTALTVEAVAALAQLRPDLLKLPAPAAPFEAAAWRDMATAAAGIPWVLYGAGASPEVFADQLRAAGSVGACGFLVGRTVWRGALAADPVVAAGRARADAAPRFRAFVSIARGACAALGAGPKNATRGTGARTAR